MTAQADADRRGAYWFCAQCIDSRHGFDDLEDAQDAADHHNRVHHCGENPDDDYHDRMREQRHE